ncbi:hypothetical protein KCM76_24290 [Zooshikella marina]|uniref:hypothetical protein n=1 Tax=Zooshikella ganghwensis TaxID=202772 RepID=UPI001BAFD2CE|nr:hypothetical protein [Zooshikella ganghwensis]MBU2709137.1 hypothetical protein [Zooshikella ganghwensis]
MESLFLSKLVLPFFSTMGAALIIMYINSVNRRVKETKQKIYAATYILDSSMRILSSEFILLIHTIKPHIEASYRIVKGDQKLLETMLLIDEFDILTVAGPDFSHIPNEFTLQLGYDNLELVQMYDTLLYLYRSDSTRKSLNDFLKDKLKSMDGFLQKSEPEKLDILNTYIDYLDRLQHEANRLIFMVSHNVLPSLEDYLKSYKFWFYSTSHANKTIKMIKDIMRNNVAYMPESDFMERVRHGGIQREIKKS